MQDKIQVNHDRGRDERRVARIGCGCYGVPVRQTRGKHDASEATFPTSAASGVRPALSERFQDTLRERLASRWRALDKTNLSESTLQAVDRRLDALVAVLSEAPNAHGAQLLSRVVDRFHPDEALSNSDTAEAFAALLSSEPTCRYRLVENPCAMRQLIKIREAARALAASDSGSKPKQAALATQIRSATERGVSSRMAASAAECGLAEANIDGGRILLRLRDGALADLLLPEFEFCEVEFCPQHFEAWQELARSSTALNNVLRNVSATRLFFGLSDDAGEAAAVFAGPHGDAALRRITSRLLRCLLARRRPPENLCVMFCAHTAKRSHYRVRTLLLECVASVLSTELYQSHPQEKQRWAMLSAQMLLARRGDDADSVSNQGWAIDVLSSDMRATYRNQEVAHGLARAMDMCAAISTAVERVLRREEHEYILGGHFIVDRPALADIATLSLCLDDANIDMTNVRLKTMLRCDYALLLSTTNCFASRLLANRAFSDRERKIACSLSKALMVWMSSLDASLEWSNVDAIRFPERTRYRSLARLVSQVGRKHFSIDWSRVRSWRDVLDGRPARGAPSVHVPRFRTLTSTLRNQLAQDGHVIFSAPFLSGTGQSARNRFLDFVGGFGEPYSRFRQPLIWSLRPTPGFPAHGSCSPGRRPLHSEGAYFPRGECPDFSVEYYPRLDPEPPTFALADGLRAFQQLPEETKEILRCAPVEITPPNYAHAPTLTTTVIDADTAAIRFNPVLINRDKLSPEQRLALNQLQQGMRVRSFALRSGDVVITDNRRYLNGRSAMRSGFSSRTRGFRAYLKHAEVDSYARWAM